MAFLSENEAMAIGAIITRITQTPESVDEEYLECSMCFGTGFAYTARTLRGKTYRGVIRCQSCTKWKTPVPQPLDF